MQLDYASILRAGQGLVPNLREQMLQGEQMAQQRQMFDLKRQQVEQAQIEAEREQRRQAEFAQERDNALLSGNPADIQRLRLRFPEYTKDMKDAFDAMDEQRRRTDLTQLGSIYARGQSGDYTGAAAILEARLKADRDAGEDDPRAAAILEALRSNDPVQQRAAMGEVGIILASVEPEKFSEVYGKLNPVESKTTTERDYDFRARLYGKAEADRWLAGQDVRPVSVEPGGTVYDARDFARPVPSAVSPPAAQGGGDPQAFGGVSAPDVGPNGFPASLTPDQYRVTVEAMGKAETDAWMARNGITMGGRSSGPVRVRSVQEARKLPSGTVFITPDGRTMRKP